jgi:hypothetical protein
MRIVVLPGQGGDRSIALLVKEIACGDLDFLFFAPYIDIV